MTTPVAPRIGAAIRSEFPIFAHTTYVNSCSQGALSHRVQAAYAQYLDGWDEHGAEWEHWVERAETMRATFARIVHAAPDEIALVTSVSQVVSALMSSIDFEHGDRKRIVVGDHEFPSVGQVAHAQELRGAEIVHVRPTPDGSIPVERFAETIDERTAIVCCATVSYRTGHRHDIGEIARLARASGALCLADSYQAIGAVDIDATALGVDVITGGTVKYLLGSAGLAFAYVRRETTERLIPTQTGWFADEDIFAMDISDYSPAREARRFEAGTPPVPSVYAGVAGASIVEDTGTAAIERHIEDLAERLIGGLDSLGATVVTPRARRERGPLVCVRSTDAETLVRELAAEHIVASSRDDNLRISLHLYNTVDDIDIVLAALEQRRQLLA